MTDPRTWLDQVDARTNAATDLVGEAYVDALSSAAGTDLPAATTALRAVLDLHRRIRYVTAKFAAKFRDVPEFVCEHCLAESDGCVPYPCPTVTAITTALEDA
ncbi:hypothetical protein [Oerskovia turbata]